jgi:hypothetical protein
LTSIAAIRCRKNTALIPPQGFAREVSHGVATWTLGYAAQTAGGQLEALTFATLTGPFGLLGGDAVLPVFHVMRSLATAAGLTRFAVASSHPASIQGLAVSALDGRWSLWLANLTGQAVSVRLEGRSGPISGGSVRSVDATTWHGAMYGASPPATDLANDTIALDPFALVQVDWMD